MSCSIGGVSRGEKLLDEALHLYRGRILDNLDLSVLADTSSRARVVATALMERGDARAFALGRQLRDIYRA